MNQGPTDVSDITDQIPPENVFTDYQLPPGKVLVLKACRSGRRSNFDLSFQYPPPGGSVRAPEWNPYPICGEGLHGWLWGTGLVGASAAKWAFYDSSTTTWLVLEVDAGQIVHLDTKVKFPCAKVIFEGSVKDCTDLIARFAPVDSLIIGRHSTAGDYGSATAGDYGTAIAGVEGTATAGIHGVATAGSKGTATAGDYGTATAGDGGTAIAGYGGIATAGDGGTAIAGYGGIATVGGGGTLMIRYWDNMHRRLAIGEVGINGIESNTPYIVRDGKLTKKVV